MADWENTLLVSLRQDLIELVELTSAVSQHLPEIELCSWLQTEATHFDSIRNSATAELTYTNCLEFLIDRLYVLLNLFIGYFNQNTARNIRRPNKLTIGRSARLLWTNITKEIRTKEMKIRENPSGNITDKNIQTEVQSLVLCDSCSISLKTMKDLSKCVEDSIVDSKTAVAKKKMRENIFELTEASAMLHLSIGIEEDVRKIVSERITLQRKLESLEKDVMQEKLQFLKLQQHALEATKLNGTKIEAIQVEVKVLEDEFKNSKSDIIVLINENKDILQMLTDQGGEMCKTKLQIHDLLNVIEQLKSNLSRHKMEKESLKQSNEDITNQFTVKTDETNTLREEFLNIKNELEQLKFAHFKVIEEIKIKTDKAVEGINSALREKFDYSKGRLDDLDVRVARIQDVVTKEAEKKEMEVLDLRNRLSEQQVIQIEDVSVRGDPLDDMTRQLEKNKLAIKILEEESASLQNTIFKLHQIRLST